MDLKEFTYFVAYLLLNAKNFVNASLQRDISLSLAMESNNTSTNYLSRKRRFVIFPEGSSFQLVFCLTYTSVGVGSYFVFGHTAALAYELPSTFLFYDQRDSEKKEEETTITTTTTTTTTEMANYHKYLKSDYYTFQDRKSPDNFVESKTVWKGQNWKTANGYYYLKNQYPSQKSHMTLEMNPKYFHIHRRTRRHLYKKIETFLNTINLDGKSCVLKAICELQSASPQKGTFLEEMFKAIFRAKPHKEHQNEDEYDFASNFENDCSELYPACSGSIRNVKIQMRK